MSDQYVPCPVLTRSEIDNIVDTIVSHVFPQADPFAKWPSCHKCSEKAGKYVPVERYDCGKPDENHEMRVKVECHGEKWTHTINLYQVAYRTEPFALFAPGYDA